MASLENRLKHEVSSTGGSPVRAENAPAARSTEGSPSRTGCQPVLLNARAARSTAACSAVAFYYEFPDAMATASEHFFSRFAQADIHTRNLPHWAASKSLIFITYRLADSMPAAKLREWQAERDDWVRLHPEPWDEATASEYYGAFPAKLDEMLDAGHGSCVLWREDCRRIVVENLLHFNGGRYVLHSFVVMPNHVHVLLEIGKREDLAKIVHGWKSYTAKKINEVTGGVGSVWQSEYYDRLIRNAAHYAHTVEYIRKNAHMAERIGSSTGGSPVREVNAPAARSTEEVSPSRTGCQPVLLNARAARSTAEDTPSRTGCQPVQKEPNLKGYER